MYNVKVSLCKISKVNEFWLERYLNIYLKVGNPRTKILIVLGIFTQSKKGRVHFFVSAKVGQTFFT